MKIKFISLLLLLFSYQAIDAQEKTNENLFEVADTLQQDFGLFKNDEILRISLLFDMKKYQQSSAEDDYIPAVLTYHINNKDSINKQIKLKSRGAYRNENCSFPPIKLNFKDADFQKADLKKIEKVKMVTHCERGNEKLLFKEFLVYKLYNVLTDFSFRVRLVEVDYVNSRKKGKSYKTFAFMIEPIDLLAERMNAQEIESINLSQKNVVPEMMDKMAVFNYMIGNTDWTIPNQHNCKLLVSKEAIGSNLAEVVPYDFDYSGLVDAPYAVPHESLGIKSVRNRLYFGICRSDEEYQSTLQLFQDKKEAFYKVINDFQYLDNTTKKEMINYLDEFYAEYENNRILKSLKNECKEY